MVWWTGPAVVDVGKNRMGRTRGAVRRNVNLQTGVAR